MTTYTTANGQILTTSGSSTRWAVNTSAAETQTGTSGNDAFSGSGGDVLIGGLGDDTYYVWDNRETIIEQPGQGIDTVVVGYSGAYTLPDNVENLILNAPGVASGTGNALNNIVVANATGSVLDGGAGDDVLVGGAGADLFIVKAGNGSDAIVNFTPGSDIVRLQGYGITSFGQLTALATQSGADVRFSFSNGESLVLRNVNLSSLSAYDFGMQPDVAASYVGLSTMVGPAQAYSAHGWTIVNNVWNPGSLIYGTDYSIATYYSATDLTKQTTFSWSFPVVIDPNPTIRAYAEIAYGLNPYAATAKSAANAFAIQIGSLSSLEVKYNVEYQGNLAGFDVAFDLWLTSRPNGDASTITNEVMIWLHKGGFNPYGSLIGTYSDGITSAKIYYQGGTRPYTAVVLDTDSTTGDIHIDSILARLKDLGVVSSSDYLASLEFGAEAASGAGTLTIHQFDLSVSQQARGSAGTSPAAPTISNFSPDSNIAGDGITSANRITLSGTADAGSTVKIFDGATQIGAVTAGANGNWSYASSTLSDGTHSFIAQAVDAAGNTSASSSSLSVTVDTIAPRPTVTMFSPDSNVSGDGITSANQITLTGTAEAGRQLQVFDGATQIGTATADGTGAWSFATATLADGVHSFTVKQTDVAGNVGISAVLNVTVDTIVPNAPVILTEAPASGNSVNVSGTAEAGATVWLYEGATLLGTGTAAANGSWTIKTGALDAGTHAFTATASDAAGNTSGPSNTLYPIVGTVIESVGSTTLTVAGTNYYISDASNVLLLEYSGAAVEAGQFGGFTPIAAEQTSSGFDVAWKMAGSDQYMVWSVGANGNYVANLTGTVSGTSSTLQSFETVFHQDLNGDGVIGVSSVTIESSGAINLVQSGNNYFINPAAGGTGLALKYLGANIVVGQWGDWAPIGAEAAGGGYQVVWKLAGADQYTVWNTDANGNDTTNTVGTVSGKSVALESLETSFHQDLNGDGFIGIPSVTIESSGAISLVQSGNNYVLNGTGPALKYLGADIVVGQWGDWAPIGAEAAGSGYQVVWKLAGADQYTVWNTDANGNDTTSIGTVSGSSAALESLETSFHQDLNGDGFIGIPSTTIESSGAISLVQSGNNYVLNGTGPALKYLGANIVVGQWGDWAPIGAEAAGSGYQVVWKLAGADQYTVWNTDANGNDTTSIGTVSGKSIALESLETNFHQDLNGDGFIGIPSTTIESSGAISLVQSGNNYFLNPTAGGTGPALKYLGANIVVGQWGDWAPIGAEAAGSGYQVVWKLAGADQYTVWNTDANGNDTTNIGTVSGSSTALKSMETTFHQDLNGDGFINSASTVIDIAGKEVLTLGQMSQSITIEAGATVELTGAVSSAITFKSATGTLILDHATQFTGTLYGLSGNGDPTASDLLDLKDISFGTGTTASFAGDSHGGVLTVQDAQHHVAHIALVGNYTASTFNLADDGSGGTMVIDPPIDAFHFAQAAASTPVQAVGAAATAAANGFVFAEAQPSHYAVWANEFSLASHGADQIHAVSVEASHAQDTHGQLHELSATAATHNVWTEGILLHA